MTRIFSRFAGARVFDTQRTMPCGEQDQIGNTLRINARFRPPAFDMLLREARGRGLIIATAGNVHGIVIEHRKQDLDRTVPTRTCGDGTIMHEHILHMAEVMICARRRRISRLQCVELFARQRQKILRVGSCDQTNTLQK